MDLAFWVVQSGRSRKTCNLLLAIRHHGAVRYSLSLTHFNQRSRRGFVTPGSISIHTSTGFDLMTFSDQPGFCRLMTIKEPCLFWPLDPLCRLVPPPSPTRHTHNRQAVNRVARLAGVSRQKSHDFGGHIRT